MAGGGTAPPLKVGDVLLLIGVSILIGTLFIQGWDIPTKVKAGDAPLEGKSRTFSGDVLEISVQTENGSNVRIEVFEDETKVYDESIFSDKSTSAKMSHESEGGELTWKITIEGDVDGEIDVDLERVFFLNYVPYIIGAIITTVGVLKKNSDEEDKEDPIDAIIEDGD